MSNIHHYDDKDEDDDDDIIINIKPRTVISKQQIKASKQIIRNFKRNRRWGMLVAQMQSGKSTTYYLVATEMIRHNIIDRAIIISGNTETNLRDQVVQNIPAFLQSYAQLFLTDMNYNEQQRIIQYIQHRIYVKWGIHEIKHTFINDDVRTLCVWDESHAAQNKMMGPDIFFTNNGISPDGNQISLEDNNLYVLSVSATPFSEDINNLHQEQHKFRVNLQVTSAYHSIKNMLQNGLIIGFNTDDLLRQFRQVMLRHNKHDTPKYALVRFRESKHISINEIKYIIYTCGWDYLTFDSSNESDIQDISELEQPPHTNTIVLLKGKCRMGKVVPNKHIAFCMETSKKPKTDTILQGLMGRMCGYNKNTNVEVYVSNFVKHSGDIERYVTYSESKEIVEIPTRAANLTKDMTTGNEVFVEYCDI